jgi:hypothetical protein
MRIVHVADTGDAYGGDWARMVSEVHGEMLKWLRGLAEE